MNVPRLDRTVHPYIPSSVPAVRAAMLLQIGVSDVEELYAVIPPELRLARPLNLPPAFRSEQELRRHVEGLLARNTSAADYLSFLGAGCYQHYVPAVCDEINGRSEFLTAYGGEPYEDHGRFQALFEYCSQMGELLAMDVVSVPTYDGAQATGTALRMAGRLTGRRTALVPRTMSAQRRSAVANYVDPVLDLVEVGYDPASGLLDLADLRSKLSSGVAAVLLENPNHLGVIEEGAAEIVSLAHAHGALAVAAVDPSSLGVLEAPGNYGVDIACGDLQTLGIHMYFGGGHGGFIASRDEPSIVGEYPSRLFGMTTTKVAGEYGFGDVMWERTSFHDREHGKEFVGTAAALWGITAGVYLALMGPLGMQELGTTWIQLGRYAAGRLSAVAGVRAPALTGTPLKEFVVDFSRTGRTVAEINTALLARGIFGGTDLSREFPELGQAALYCVTEVHSREDIDRLVSAVAEVVS